MKKLLYLLTASVTLSFTSCLDSEEKIALKEDGSGTYSITMDMAKMMGMLSAFGGENKKPEKKDTVIYFKDFTDTSTTLTADEKEILKNGKVGIHMDSDKGEMKIVMDANFKNVDQLVYLRNNFQEMIQKTHALDNLKDKKEITPGDEEMPSMTPKMGPPKANTNPFKDYYEFTATANSLSYKVKDKEAALKAMETNEELQMMKKMAPMMGDMTFATTIVLPRPAIKIEGSKAKLSNDKKTVTVASTFKEIFSNLESLAFKVEY
ncbi:MAG: hypothetical protein ACM3H8_07110 [Sphingobacteriales bacterium]